MMIAMESGTAHTGEWREEMRNVFEDYRRCFSARWHE
ncbi:MAG: DUF3047 domain-containing protein [Deltaproteobacteria bacterium]|nr:MAG: DUF3047 domain-containing protein [Deltaproteobacteria bacterium]UCF56963.1 MAG: DUF3047 domain-containing protein [Deltaproteobacteria bacterium]